MYWRIFYAHGRQSKEAYHLGCNILSTCSAIVLYLDMSSNISRPVCNSSTGAWRPPDPRCAFVDLAREEISPMTSVALFDVVKAPRDALPKVIRSKELDVYFSNSDYLLVR